VKDCKLIGSSGFGGTRVFYGVVDEVCGQCGAVCHVESFRYPVKFFGGVSRGGGEESIEFLASFLLLLRGFPLQVIATLG